MFRRAPLTTAEHGEVRAVENEPALGKQALRKRFDERRIRIDDRAAGVTDDVDVLVLSRSVGRRTVPEMGMSDEPDLLEQFQRAVDGGDVDALDRFTDLLGRCVPEPANGVQHLLALRSRPKPEFAQSHGELAAARRTRMRSLVHSHPCHGR